MQPDLKHYQHDSPDEIMTMLTQVVRAHAPVSVQGEIGSIDAIVNAVHLTGPYLALVSEAPQDRVRALSACAQLLIAVSVGSGRLEFSVAGNAVQFVEESHTLMVALPTRMLRIDRREHYRVALGSAKPVRCELRLADGAGLSAEAFDLSTGGIGLTVTGAATNLASGMTLSRCRLHLPRAPALTVDLEIRHRLQQEVDAQRSARLGCRFLNLAPSDIQEIRRFLSESY